MGETMCAVKKTMSKYDNYDDYQDDDEVEDEEFDDADEEEGDDAPRSSASNPFSRPGGASSGSAVRGAGINPPPRPAGTGAGAPPASGGSAPSPVQRTPLGGGSGSGSSGGAGGSSPFNRPSGTSGGSGGSSNPAPSRLPGSPGSGSSSGSGGSSNPAPGRLPGSSGSGSSSGSGGSSNPAPGRLPGSPGGGSQQGGSSSGSGGSGGSSPFNRPSGTSGGGSQQGGSSSGSGGSGGSSSFNRPSGTSDSGSQQGGSSSGSGGSGGSNSFNRPSGTSGGGSQQGGSSSGSGGSGANRLPGSTSSSGGSARDDDKGGSRGGLGGLAGRFGGGNKADDKKPDNKRDEKPSGGGLSGLAGGLAGRFGGGNKADDKPSASSARPASSSSTASRTEEKPSGGGLSGLAGGLAGRLPFGSGSKDAPKGGSSAPSGTKPVDKAATSAVGGAGRSTSFGNRGGDVSKPPSATGSKGGARASAATAVPITERIRGGVRNFINPPKNDKSAKARISKAPKVRTGGMSLDTKLDILGVALVLIPLAILLSSLSPSQGQIFGSINGALSVWFGWGALAIPIFMLGVGVYLILRHFGDEAPVVGAQRLIGLGLLFVGLLALAQYINALDYPPGEGQSYQAYLDSLRNILLPLSAQFGRGGGRVGGEFYYQLLSNFGEIGGFLIIVGVLVIGFMLALKLSAAEIAIIVTSVGRSLGTSVSRRQQASSIRRAERADAQAQAAPAAISVMRPPDTLPAGRQSALPAPIPAPAIAAAGEERKIQLTTRGQSVTTAFRSDAQEEAAIPVAMPAMPMPQPAAAALTPPTINEPRRSLFGGRGNNVPATAQSVAPVTSPNGSVPPVGAPNEPKRSLFGNRGASTTPPTTQPMTVGGASPAPTTPNEPKRSLFGNRGASTTPPTTQPMTVGGVSPAAATASMAAPSLGDLARASMTAPAPSPFAPERAGLSPAAATATPTQAVGIINPAPTTAPPIETMDAINPAPVTRAPMETPTASTPAPTTGGIQPMQRPPLTAAIARSVEDEDDENAAPPIPGLTAPVVTARSPRITSTSESAPAPAMSSAPPPPPPSARGSGVLGGSVAAAALNARDTKDDDERGFAAAPPPRPRQIKDWRLPEVSQLLMSGQDQELDHSLLLRRAKIIEETLDSFGAPGRVVEVRTGPVITQFGIEPDYIMARGKKNRVKVSSIAGLDKDLQLALGAKSIRIEAPVPGKGYVGIEVPNEQSAVVRLRDVLESDQFRKITGPLAIALGQGVDGTPVAADLAGMPHLLIAGTTGSGKSVCVNSIITSLILRNPPSKLKFIMIDPKRVELTQYNGIPHLIAPVVVDTERTTSVLKWVTREMDDRYKRFSAAGARNIEDYNRHVRSGEEPMPYMVVIIDELADLMMLAPDETEKVITRIAALARATGIHLVIATQRPSVDVVTGLIKANFPARIAFAVAGGVDSRVILDQPGAERLLGRGDMLYMSGDAPSAVRLQGVFVSDTEINNITRHWRGQMSEEDLISASRPLASGFADDTRHAVDNSRGGDGGVWNPLVTGRGTPAQPAASTRAMWDQESRAAVVQSVRRNNDDDSDLDGDGEDDMYDQAVELIRTMGKASVSLLQRRLRIGYTRAARLIDLMEERGIVGPAKDGSNPRDVIS